MTKQIIATALIAWLASMGVALSAEKTYKWIDEKGVVHYTDKIPLEAINRGQTVLDKQARQVQQIEAVQPEDKRKISEAEAEQLRLEQHKKDIAERKDRALQLSYLKAEDIDFARDRALVMLDAQIESTAVMLTQQQTRHKELLEREEKGGVLPEGELEKLEADIAARNAAIERDKQEKEKVYAKYARDKQRWIELKAAERAKMQEAASNASGK